MDTSKEYIKMCGCPEIQGQKPKGNEFTISYKNPDIWIEHEGSFLYAKHDIWLPRQDQIQEMMGKDYENTLDMLCDFYAIITVDQPMGFQQMFEVSMEQLWLVFYMYKNHVKRWNGKNWSTTIK